MAQLSTIWVAGCDQEAICSHPVGRLGGLDAIDLDNAAILPRLRLRRHGERGVTAAAARPPYHAELVEIPDRATRVAATAPILTGRLSLVLMDEAVLEALARRDRQEASELLAAHLPSDFPAPDGSDDTYIRLQREKLRAHSEQREWCARLMVRLSDRAAVGHCGFHGPPRALGRAEIGYTVFPAHRGQGLATEAVAAMVAWAWEQGERTVVAGVPPANLPSLGVVRKVGFVQTGRRVDPVYASYGEELVFEITRPSR